MSDTPKLRIDLEADVSSAKKNIESVINTLSKDITPLKVPIQIDSKELSGIKAELEKLFKTISNTNAAKIDLKVNTENISKSTQSAENALKSLGNKVSPINIPFQIDLKNSNKIKAEMERVKDELTKGQGTLIDFKVNTKITEKGM